MKLRTGDQIEVIAGKDRGKRGKIVRVFPKEDKVLVENVNIVLKHKRAKNENEKGARVEVPVPVHVSNVMLVCPHTGKPTRIGTLVEGGEKVRVSKRSGKTID